MPIVKTSLKSQILIPKPIRDRLGIQPGVRVLITLNGDHAEVRPAFEDPIQALRGRFKDYPGSLTQELLEDRGRDTAIDEKNLF
ncbi:MAG: hypothetical protein B1H02_01540 [Candidatus Latescibacteria bacterium 4484_107]|nr:MAG: hypothetical protein B1H02_01540 [Candidatus Latescibacteria bacterium 4484_107]